MASHLARIVSAVLLASLAGNARGEPVAAKPCASSVGVYLEPALVILLMAKDQGPWAARGAAGVRVNLCHSDAPRFELRGGLTFDATDTPVNNLLGGELELAVRAGDLGYVGVRGTVRSEDPFSSSAFFGVGVKLRRGPVYLGVDVSAVHWNDYYSDGDSYRTVTTHDTMWELGLGLQGKAGGYTGLVGLGLLALGGLVVVAAAPRT